jgi:hypothetical protein
MPRHPLSAEFAVEVARAVADEPSFLAFVGVGTQILIAARPHDLAPLDVEEACRRLLAGLGPEERGPTYLVSVDPGFGTDPTPALAVWPELERRFAEAGGRLLDWLLVCDEAVASVAAAARSSLAAGR